MVSTPTITQSESASLLPSMAGERGVDRLNGTIGARPSQPTNRGTQSWGTFSFWFIFYTALGFLIALKYGYHDGDGLARTANAAYVLFSRDPHVAAVGFIWNPLPSLVQLPVLLLRGWFPDLETQGLAGVIMSAAFMAGAVVQLRKFMLDREATRFAVAAVPLVFALTPIVILYGANGMSEAPYLFFIILAVRRLTVWMHTDDVVDLIVAGSALGLGFLSRYEFAAISAGAALLVGLVAFVRTEHETIRERCTHALVDVAVLIFPFLLSFGGWAVSGYIITGSAFSQFSSVYGNSTQVAGNAGFDTANGLLPAISASVSNIMHLELLLLVVLVLAIYLAVVRRDYDILPALFLIGAGTGFVMASYILGSTLANIRYYIIDVPLMVMAIGLLFPRGDIRVRPHAARGRPHWHVRPLGVGLTAIVVLVCALPSIPVSLHSMQSETVDLSDYGIRSIFYPKVYPPSQDAQILQGQRGAQIADFVDALRLPESSVLVDTYLGFPIVIASPNQKQFVVTSDYDFTQYVNDPRLFGVRYLLVPQPTSAGLQDALNRRYPTLWSKGAGIAHLVVTFPSTVPGVPSWRLYQINT